MIEMSAAKSPALALAGAVSAAGPAVPSVDGAQSVDFSMVLAGATLAGEASATLNDMLVQPDAETPPALEPLPNPAILPGKSGMPGNANGKNLPAGKLPTPRLAAVVEKTVRKQLSEGAEAKDDTAGVATEADVVAPADSINATPVKLDSIEALPVAPNALPMAPAPEVNIASAPHQNVATPELADNETHAKPQPTLTKLQARQQAKLQPQVVAAKTTSAAAEPAAAVRSGTPAPEVRPLEADRQATTRSAAPHVAIPSPDDLSAKPAPVAGKAASAPAMQGAIRQASSLDATLVMPASIAPAPDAAVTIAPAPIVLKAATPATITLTAPAPIAAETPIVGASPNAVLQDAERVVTLQATSEPIRALAAVLPGAAPVAEEAAGAPRKAAILAATLPAAAMPIASTPAAPLPAVPTPINLATVIVGESEARPAPAAPTAAVSAQPMAASAASMTTPTIAPAPIAEAAAFNVPAAQDRSVTAAAAPQPVRSEATMMPAVLAVAEKDHKVASAANAPASITATETALPFARPVMDASTLAAEFRSVPTPAAPATSTASATPTQDIAALVDRITEARAAASPHSIRASLVHEDFGAVSVNLRTEASHIHVTLGSADPGFAPAVQAAAASASLAGNNSDEANARRDAPTPQAFTPTQDNSARADTSSQQQAGRDRAPAPERNSTREAQGRSAPAAGERDASPSASRRRGGLYA